MIAVASAVWVFLATSRPMAMAQVVLTYPITYQECFEYQLVAQINRLPQSVSDPRPASFSGTLTFPGTACGPVTVGLGHEDALYSATGYNALYIGTLATYPGNYGSHPVTVNIPTDYPVGAYDAVATTTYVDGRTTYTNNAYGGTFSYSPQCTLSNVILESGSLNGPQNPTLVWTADFDCPAVLVSINGGTSQAYTAASNAPTATSWQMQYSCSLENLPLGVDSIDISSADINSHRVSAPMTVDYVAQYQCMSPSLISPASGTVNANGYPEFTANVDGQCGAQTLSVTMLNTAGRQASSPATFTFASGSSFSGTLSAQLFVGAYEWALASSGLGRLTSPSSSTNTFTVACPIPVITSPSSNNLGEYTVTGSNTLGASNDPNPCGAITIVTTRPDGSSTTDGATADSRGDFTGTQHLYIQPGVYKVTVTNSNGVSAFDSSYTTSFTIGESFCPPLEIGLNQDPVRPASPGAPVSMIFTVNSPNAGCPILATSIDGVSGTPTITQANTPSGITWTVIYEMTMADGEHSFTTVSSATSGSSATAPGHHIFQFLVASNCPIPEIVAPTPNTYFFTSKPTFQATGSTTCPDYTILVDGTSIGSGSATDIVVTPTSDISNGQHTLQISFSGPYGNSPASTEVVFNIQTICGSAIVVPTTGDFYVEIPSFTIAAPDSFCNSITLSISAISGGAPVYVQTYGPVSSQNTTITIPQPLANGQYVYSYINLPGGSSGPNPSLPVSGSFTIGAIYCPTPVITSPSSMTTTVFANFFTISGTASDLTDCGVLNWGLTASDIANTLSVPESQYSYTFSRNADESFTATQGTQGTFYSGPNTDVTQTFYFAFSGNPGKAPPGQSVAVDVTFAVATCAAPVATLPVNGSTVSSGAITFSGTDPNGGMPQCIGVQVYIAGQTLNTYVFDATSTRRAKRAATRNWSVSIPVASALSNGNYPFYVTALQNTDTPWGLLVANANDPVNNQVSVLNAATVTGGTSRKKRTLRCQPDEEYCVVTLTSGKKAEQCVKDPSSNLEYCGDCRSGYDDCTIIKNVDTVACVMGRCEVSSCEEGYSLANGSCISAP